MVKSKAALAYPLRVVVKPGSRAEEICRNYAAGAKVAPKRPAPREEVIAGGFQPRPALNLRDRRGKVITDLVYTNFFVGGAAWDAQDRANIDSSLAKAMSDQGLNNVLIQYFRGAANISSTFRPSTLLTGDPPDTVSQPQVEDLVRELLGNGGLDGFDFASTVFNFMLARATVLTIGAESGVRRGAHKTTRPAAETDEQASSLQGLGGFHGSVDVRQSKIYYAVGVFSEGGNGIVAFDQPWKNVVATFYHELTEARTDADVEDGGVAWVNDERPGEEIGDIPMTLAGANLDLVMKEVPLSDRSGTVPIQLMWSNAVSGPEGPISSPHPPAAPLIS
jgi:hypothetical protein